MIFKGTYEHTIDAKGRMFVPAKFRDGLGDTFVIFKWVHDKCLFAMSPEAFENFSATMDKNPENANLMERVLYPSATDVEQDAQKRVLIPSELRAYANIDKDVAVVGVNKRVEIWDLKTWKEKMKQDEEMVRATVGDIRISG